MGGPDPYHPLGSAPASDGGVGGGGGGDPNVYRGRACEWRQPQTRETSEKKDERNKKKKKKKDIKEEKDSLCRHRGWRWRNFGSILKGAPITSQAILKHFNLKVMFDIKLGRQYGHGVLWPWFEGDFVIL